MSSTLRELRERIRSVRRLRQVTCALEKVASVRLISIRLLEEQSRLYAEAMGGLLADLYERVNTDSPLAREPGAGSRCLVVFGSDSGLCGAFSTRLVSASLRLVEESLPNETRALVVGRATYTRAMVRGLNVEERFSEPARGKEFGFARAIRKRVIDGFISGKYAEVTLVYNRVVRGTGQQTAVVRAIPVSSAGADLMPGRTGEATWLDNALWEPAPAEVLARLLEDWVLAAIWRALVSSMVCEYASREMTMHRATENADRMTRDLTMSYNRARQEQITTEITEVVAGGSERWQQDG